MFLRFLLDFASCFLVLSSISLAKLKKIQTLAKIQVFLPQKFDGVCISASFSSDVNKYIHDAHVFQSRSLSSAHTRDLPYNFVWKTIPARPRPPTPRKASPNLCIQPEDFLQ